MTKSLGASSQALLLSGARGGHRISPWTDSYRTELPQTRESISRVGRTEEPPVRSRENPAIFRWPRTSVRQRVRGLGVDLAVARPHQLAEIVLRPLDGRIFRRLARRDALLDAADLGIGIGVGEEHQRDAVLRL